MLTAEMSLVVCDKAEKAQLLLEKAPSLKSLKCLVIMDTISDKNKQTAKEHNIRLVAFKDVLVSRSLLNKKELSAFT